MCGIYFQFRSINLKATGAPLLFSYSRCFHIYRLLLL